MTGNSIRYLDIAKPCPLCGTYSQRFTCEIVGTECCYHPHNARYLFPGRDTYLFKIQCQCGLSFERKEASAEDFIAKWNRRKGGDT